MSRQKKQSYKIGDHHASCTHAVFVTFIGLAKHKQNMFTVFPRNLAAAGFYFKAPFGVATIRGWLDFKDGVYRDRHARAYRRLQTSCNFKRRAETLDHVIKCFLNCTRARARWYAASTRRFQT